MDTYASIFGQAQPFSGAWYGLHSDWLRCHSSRLSTSKTTSALLQGTAIFFFTFFVASIIDKKYFYVLQLVTLTLVHIFISIFLDLKIYHTFFEL